jgi:hypothetical protein
MKENIYGLMAEFETPEELLAAAKRAYREGYRQMEGYSPFPVEGLAEALGHKKTLVPLIVLLCAIAGGLGGYFMEYYAMKISYPINVGGRPLNSWPAFIPITFELTILGGALSAVIGMLALNRLPRPHHPVFNAPHFERASVDRFFLCVEAGDAKFNPEETRKFLESLRARSVSEVSE